MVIIASAAAGLTRYFSPSEYQATASLLFRQTSFDSTVLDGSPYFLPATDPVRAAATNLELLRKSDLADRVAKEVGGTADRDTVKGAMAFRLAGDSDLVQISATTEDPQFSERLANAWAREFVAFRRETDRAQIQEAIDLVNSELARLEGTPNASERTQDLSRRREQLLLAQSLQTGDVEFVQPASIPTSREGVSVAVAAVLGGIAGLLLGVGLAVLLQRRDNKIRPGDEASELFAPLPVLQVVPRARRRRDSSSDPAVEEAFRTLTARMQFLNVDAPKRVIAIVGSRSGEGKSYVAAGLAATLASSGHRTLLVDADLRRGALSEFFRTDARVSGIGLSSLLADSSGREVAIVRVQPGGGPDPQQPAPVKIEMGHSLSLIPRGPAPPNPLQLLASQRLKALLSAAKADYDYVLIDTAPLLEVGDTLPLLGAVDGFIVVTRSEVSTRQDFLRARELWTNSPQAPLGVVINGASLRAAGGSDYYGTVG